MALSITWADSATDSTDLSSYTFSGLEIGSAASDRWVLVAAGSDDELPTGVTIGGVAATQCGTGRSNANDGSASLWRRKVTSGTSADIVVSFGATMSMCAVTVYRVVGAQEIQVASTAGSTADTNGVISASLTIPSGGVGIGVVMGNAGAANAYTWSGLTEDTDVQPGTDTGNFFRWGTATSSTAGTATRQATDSETDWNGALFLVALESAFSTVSPGLVSDADTFYAPSVTTGSVTVSPGLVVNDSGVVAARVVTTFIVTDEILTPLGAGALGDMVLGGLEPQLETTLEPTLYSDADTFYAPTVTNTNTLSPALYSDPETFYAPTVTAQARTLSPSLFYDGSDPKFDVSGNGHDLVSITGATSATGKIGGALSFNGSSDWAKIPASGVPSWWTDVSFSVSVWFKTTSSGAIFGHTSNTDPTSTPSGFVPAMYIDSAGDLRSSLIWRGSTTTCVSSVGDLRDGFWHLATAVIDASANTETLYIDNVQTDQDTSISPTDYNTGTYAYQLGAAHGSASWPNFPTSGWSYFNGELDDARIYDRALSSAEVTTLQAQNGPSDTFSQWPLESTGDTFYAPTVTNVNTLSPALYSDADTFYAPTIQRVITASLYSDPEVFYAPTVTPGAVSVSTALFVETNIFYSPFVRIPMATPGWRIVYADYEIRDHEPEPS